MSSAQRAHPEEPVAANEEGGHFPLPPLPWATNALEPVLSSGAVELHYQKHHRGYIEKLNKLVTGTPFEAMPLEQVIRESAKDEALKAIFNNAGQAWNHTFFFQGLKPPGPAHVPKALRSLIDTSFGSLEAMNAELAKTAVDRFGSGWAWLTMSGGALEITTTANAESPLTTGAKPLLTLDVWEHAYYLDYHERRDSYARSVLSTLINWDVVAARAGLSD